MLRGWVIKIWLVSLIALMCAMPTLAFSAEDRPEKTRSAFSLRDENDAFGGTDEYYTNGISLALTKEGKGLLGGVWNLFGEPEGKRFAGYELSQLQFTPTDFGPNPDPADRPYAGFLYLGFMTHLQREESLHSFKLFAGVVGRASLAEGLQKATHRLFGYNLPQGWNHQIKNEPILNLLYEYRRRIHLTPRDEPFGIDIIPMGGAMLGNYLTQAQVNAQLRFGYNLPADYGTTLLRTMGYLPFPQQAATGPDWGIYAFAGGGANLVARNITLDGNTFAHSRSVDSRPLVPMAEFGASVWFWRLQTTVSYVMLGKEFYGQRERQDYGSVLLSYFFR